MYKVKKKGSTSYIIVSDSLDDMLILEIPGIHLLSAFVDVIPFALKFYDELYLIRSMLSTSDQILYYDGVAVTGGCPADFKMTQFLRFKNMFIFDIVIAFDDICRLFIDANDLSLVGCISYVGSNSIVNSDVAKMILIMKGHGV